MTIITRCRVRTATSLLTASLITLGAIPATAALSLPRQSSNEVLVGVGDYVWIDENGDGRPGLDETPLPGVIVTLYEPDGVTPVMDANGEPATITSNERGFYFIDALYPGDYRAQFTLPSGYGFTEALVPPNDTDSDPDPLTGLTDVFSVDAGVVGDTVVDDSPWTEAQFQNKSIYAGAIELVGVGDTVWIDADANGVQDEGERPLPGVTVTLMMEDGVTPAVDAFGEPVVDVTDTEGRYLLDGIRPEAYRAQFTLPDGYVFATGAVTTGETPPVDASTTDSDPDPVTGLTPVFVVVPEVTGNTVLDLLSRTKAFYVDASIDAGVTYGALVGITDDVWIDDDGDGLQGPTEPVLSDVTVTLLRADDLEPASNVDGEPATATTDATGRFTIDAMLPGTYVAEFQLPSGYSFTRAFMGEPRLDSNVSSIVEANLARTPPFTLRAEAAGQMETDSDPNTRADFVNASIGAGAVVGDKVPSEPRDSSQMMAWIVIGLLVAGGGIAMVAVRRRRLVTPAIDEA